jgi:hypothetical protein
VTDAVATYTRPYGGGVWNWPRPIECPQPGCLSRDVDVLNAAMREHRGGEVAHIAFMCLERHVFVLALTKRKGGGLEIIGNPIGEWTPADDVGLAVSEGS